MIFSSPIFVFAFLPVVFLIAMLVRRFKRSTIPLLLWMTLSSLFFYGFWEASYLPIILISIAANWLMGRWIQHSDGSNRIPLFIGICGNIAAIGYYKYFDFLTSNINSTLGTSLPELGLLLPLGISFFTFQQIAYLVDTSRGLTGKTNILEYAFFVSFFPQLIAGPIVHHRHILPAIHKGESFNFSAEQVLAGLHAFAIGFFKKVVIADSLLLASNAVFNAADAGQSLSSHDAILGTLSFTFHIYFDFSAYTDMAIGLALMFGVQLPKNFDSPFKATGFIDFWQRWHITLSEFLRDYVYIPLGGQSQGCCTAVFQLTLHNAHWWTMARRNMDLRVLGRHSRCAAHGKSRSSDHHQVSPQRPLGTTISRLLLGRDLPHHRVDHDRRTGSNLVGHARSLHRNIHMDQS